MIDRFGQYSKIFVWDSRRQLVPVFSTISISNIYAPQTKILDGRTNLL